jgi:hypothetical protein
VANRANAAVLNVLESERDVEKKGLNACVQAGPDL